MEDQGLKMVKPGQIGSLGTRGLLVSLGALRKYVVMRDCMLMLMYVVFLSSFGKSKLFSTNKATNKSPVAALQRRPERLKRPVGAYSACALVMWPR